MKGFVELLHALRLLYRAATLLQVDKRETERLAKEEEENIALKQQLNSPRHRGGSRIVRGKKAGRRKEEKRECKEECPLCHVATSLKIRHNQTQAQTFYVLLLAVTPFLNKSIM